MGKSQILNILQKPNRSGQAIIEYLIMLSLMIAVMAILATGLRRTIRKVWVTMAKDIAAPCPTSRGNGCLPPEQIK